MYKNKNIVESTMTFFKGPDPVQTTALFASILILTTAWLYLVFSLDRPNLLHWFSQWLVSGCRKDGIVKGGWGGGRVPPIAKILVALSWKHFKKCPNNALLLIFILFLSYLCSVQVVKRSLAGGDGGAHVPCGFPPTLDSTLGRHSMVTLCLCW